MLSAGGKMSEIIKKIINFKISAIVNLSLWSMLLTMLIMNDKFEGGIDKEIVLSTVYLFAGIILANGFFFVIFRLVTMPLRKSVRISYLASNITVTTLFMVNYITVLIYGRQLGMEGFVMAVRGWQGGEMGDFTANMVKLLLSFVVYGLLFYFAYRGLDRLLKGRYFHIRVSMGTFTAVFIVTLVLHLQLVAMASSDWKISIIKQKIPWQGITGFPEDLIKVDENSGETKAIPKLFANPEFLSEKTEVSHILKLKEMSRKILSSNIKADKKMNIIFMNVEGLRHDMLNPVNAPNLYKFVKEKAFNLQRHYSTGNNTPGSLFGMLTGLTPYYFEALRQNGCPSVALEVLKKLGYRETFYFNSPKNYEYIYRDLMEKTANEYVSIPGVKEDYAPRERKLVDRFLADLRNHKGGPRFDYYLMNVTHFNYYYPENFRKFTPDYKMDFQIISGSQQKFRKHKIGLMNRYKNAVYYFDYLFGIMIRDLEKTGRLKNTIIVLSGDHGEEFWEHGSFGHTWGLNNIQIQPAAFIYYPGVKSDSIKYKYTSHCDFMPTVFDLIGLNLDYKQFTAGKSLVSYNPERDYVISSLGILTSFKRNGYAIIGNGYKILYKNGKNLNDAPYAVYDDEDHAVKNIDPYKTVDLLLKTKKAKSLF